MARPEKVAAVKEISERFSNSEAALLTDYRGLSVGQMAEVRQALRDADSDTDYKVSKNSLARIAVKDLGLDDLIELLVGPTAIAYVTGDAAAAAKAIDTVAKKYPVLKVKGGILAGKFISAEQATELAKLEPRETQLAKIAMMMNQPAQLTVNVLAALLRDLGSMLVQVVTQKESDAPPAEETPSAEAPAEETPSAETPAEEAPSAEAPAEEAPSAEATSASEEAPSDSAESTDEDAATDGEKEETSGRLDDRAKEEE
jgi:large subunit ribosomal protein L10